MRLTCRAAGNEKLLGIIKVQPRKTENDKVLTLKYILCFKLKISDYPKIFGKLI